jgi:hypothetical protein
MIQHHELGIGQYVMFKARVAVPEGVPQALGILDIQQSRQVKQDGSGL